MDALTLITIAVLIGGALALIFYPLWQQTRPEAVFRVDGSGQTLEEYEARYQALLEAIRDLMFDHEMGKVATEDYETLLNRTKLEAANVRRHIDQLNRSAPESIEAGLEAEIEALIAQTGRAALNGNEALLREVEAEIELLKQVKPGPQMDVATPVRADGLTCPHCAQPVQSGDAFCARCGQSLAGLEAKENVCPECGYEHQPDDAFCARCGTTLTQAQQQTGENAKTTEFST
ncbi:MAG TPA: zinc ribbon domain-containing protein [Anaerolineae bacterium]|jgi:DNA-directed RNA polymerase subunit RPC12/RpoP